MNTYVVTMYRFGRRNKHSYVLWVYSSKKRAKKYARIEEADKYKAEILEVVVDKEYDNVNEMVEIKLGDD